MEAFDDMPALPTVRVYASLGVVRECPVFYRRGVWAACRFDDFAIVVHAPSGYGLGFLGRGTARLGNDTAINVVRAMTPWADYCATQQLGDGYRARLPREAYDAFVAACQPSPTSATDASAVSLADGGLHG